MDLGNRLWHLHANTYTHTQTRSSTPDLAMALRTFRSRSAWHEFTQMWSCLCDSSPRNEHTTHSLHCWNHKNHTHIWYGSMSCFLLVSLQRLSGEHCGRIWLVYEPCNMQGFHHKWGPIRIARIWPQQTSFLFSLSELNKKNQKLIHTLEL